MATNRLATLLPDWHMLLQGWSVDGQLSAAAQEALLLDGEPELLKELVGQWAAGDFSTLPPITLLPASSMPGAAGAYAISTGTIYINQDWLQTASRERVMAVLTEELGHHLDGLLNAVDTPGDEGEYYAILLRDRLLKVTQISASQDQFDAGVVLVKSMPISAEFSTLPPPGGIVLPSGITIVHNEITGTASSERFWLDNYVDYLSSDNTTITVYGQDGDDIIDSGNVFLNGSGLYPSGTLARAIFYGGNGNDFLVGRTGGTTEAYGGNGFDELLTDVGDFITTRMSYGASNGKVVFERPQSTTKQYAKFTINGDIELLKDFGGNCLIVSDLLNGSIRYLNQEQAAIYRQSWESGNSRITLAVSPTSVTEDGTSNLVYTFTRTGSTTSPLTVNYTVGGTARLVASGSDPADYAFLGSTSTATSRTVTFAANSATATVTVDPIADTRIEANETVALTLAAGTGYTIGTTTAVTGTITNDDIKSAVSAVIGSDQSSLRFGGTRRINGTGNSLDNTIIGNTANNRITGLGGKDILTGGGGTADRDVFVFSQLSDSLLLNPAKGKGSYFDEITDFNRNDRISAPFSVETDLLTASAGIAASLSPAAIGSVLTAAAFQSNSVAAFTTSRHAGTFIAMNDGRAGFQADSDSVVWLRNYSISASYFVEFI